MRTAAGRTADVLLAVRGSHEERLAQEFSSPGADVRVVRRCADLSELIAAATAGIGTAALICAEQQGLDREVVSELHAHGITVVALTEATDGWQAERMGALGVDAVCRLDEAPEQLVAVLTAPPDLAEGDGTKTPDGESAAIRDSAARSPRGTHFDRHPPGEQRQGQIVAIWGPGGAPGRTSLAINLATELAATPTPRQGAGPNTNTEVLLVDADTHNPSLAQHLALLDESAGLAVASRAASQGRLDLVRLAELTPRLDRHLRVLSGIGRPVRWPEAPSSSLEVVWEKVRELADFTVVDTGPQIESDEALTYDTRAPQRNGATLSALSAADLVIIVGGTDPVAIQRLVRALAELKEAGLNLRAKQLVVLNRVRASVVGAQPDVTLREALARYAAVNVDVLIPDDSAGFDNALLAGRTLAEAQPHSAARRAIAELAEQVRRIMALPAVGG